MKIKTYPLQFTEDKLDAIKKEATNRNQSIKDFIHTAIENSLANKPMKESKV